MMIRDYLSVRCNQHLSESANDSSDRDPKSWKLEGSTDGTNWTTLDTRTNITFSNRYEREVFRFTNDCNYQYYLLNITANNGSTQYTQLADFGLMMVAGDKIDYAYDDDGYLYGFYYNGITYIYVRNGQNDITGILDSSGNLVVSYEYDSWGKVLSVTGSMASTIGERNPFRYRGYYYDTETGLFYVGSRYYDPVVGRFINADDTFDPNAGLLSTNLFAYCSNNPVNLTDSNGHFAQLAVAGAYGTLAVGAEAGAANVWNPVGWAILGACAVATIGLVSYGGYTYYQENKKKKPINLPSYKRIKLDMDHILSGHGSNGKRGGPNKDRFPNWMKASAIASAIRYAYRYGEVLQRQGDRVFMEGPWEDYTIQMWVNTVKKVIESAWPKY